MSEEHRTRSAGPQLEDPLLGEDPYSIPIEKLPPLPEREAAFYTEPFCGVALVGGLCFFLVTAVRSLAFDAGVFPSARHSSACRFLARARHRASGMRGSILRGLPPLRRGGGGAAEQADCLAGPRRGCGAAEAQQPRRRGLLQAFRSWSQCEQAAAGSNRETGIRQCHLLHQVLCLADGAPLQYMQQVCD